MNGGKAVAVTNASGAAANLRESLTSEAVSRRSDDSDKRSSVSSGSNLRGVYETGRAKDKDSRREKSTSRECSRSRSRSPGSIENLSKETKFRGSDLDSVFGKRVFGKPSVQAPTAPSVGLGRGVNGNGSELRGTQIPSADIHMESNRALGFHL